MSTFDESGENSVSLSRIGQMRAASVCLVEPTAHTLLPPLTVATALRLLNFAEGLGLDACLQECLS
jgi:hypothetical protein